MVLKLKKINKHTVEPVQLKTIRRESIRGHQLFDELYANVFICSKKKSGKSSLIFKILKECTGKETKIIIFSGTVKKDPTYRYLIKYFTNKGNDVIIYDSITEDKINNLTNVCESLLQNENSDDTDIDSTEDDIYKYIIKTGDDAEKIKKKRKDRLISPEIIFVFDDLSTELRNIAVSGLLKCNRHAKSKVLISSQYVHDLKPESIKQMDYCILFGGHSDDKLEKFHKDLDLSIELNKFIEIYKEITNEKYNFLYIDVINEKLRKNFDNEIEID
jgi:hypothetical protein